MSTTVLKQLLERGLLTDVKIKNVSHNFCHWISNCFVLFQDFSYCEKHKIFFGFNKSWVLVCLMKKGTLSLNKEWYDTCDKNTKFKTAKLIEHNKINNKSN